MRKKLLLVVCAALMICLLAGCQETVRIDGLDRFHKEQSDLEVTLKLLPSDNFLDRFSYINGDYHYKLVAKSYISPETCEQAIVVLEYDQETYQRAKNHCLKVMRLSDTNKKELNGYQFIQNICMPIGYAESSTLYLESPESNPYSYPEWFNMLCYNDEKQLLIFLGFQCSSVMDDAIPEKMENWGAFLDEFYGEFFDFDA